MSDRSISALRTLRPELDVRGCFLDLCAPRLNDVLREPAVVVPLLLGKAYHARVDVPAAVAESRVPAVVSDVLGPDPRLVDVLRDRLVQAFERARLVAADVVAELAPLGELSEYVNLSPTTGPVPVMVPASRSVQRP